MKKLLSLMLALVMLVSAFSGIRFEAKAAGVSGQDIVNYAKQFDGYPYVWGTQGPNSFDCSGFVYYVFKHFGIYLPPSSSEYWNNPKKYGTVVGEDSVANAQPGDVLSWNGHVAIYIGNNHTVEAVGKKWGVVYNYPLNYHSNKHYRVIRIKGVNSSAPVVEVPIEDTVVDGIPNGWMYDEMDGAAYYYTKGMSAMGWKQIEGSWYYFSPTEGNGVHVGQMLTGWITVKGVKYYLAENGVRVTGWKVIGGKQYLFKYADGAMLTGWYTAGNKSRYYFDASGPMAVGCRKINGKWYLFKYADGTMITGWYKSGSKQYYYGTDGARAEGITAIGGKRYYFNSDGVMTPGWHTVNGKRYLFKYADGTMLTGWYTAGNKNKYYFGTDGAMYTGWQSIGGKRYLFTYADGRMLTGWYTAGNKSKYYFDTDGAMVTGSYRMPVNGTSCYFLFNENGVMQTGWKDLDGRHVYFNPDGTMAVGWQTIDGKRYLFKYFNGDMMTGWYIAGNQYHYYLGDDGVLRKGWHVIDGEQYLFTYANGMMLTGWYKSGNKRFYFNSDGKMARSTTMEIDGKTYTFNASGVCTEG